VLIIRILTTAKSEIELKQKKWHISITEENIYSNFKRITSTTVQATIRDVVIKQYIALYPRVILPFMGVPSYNSDRRLFFRKLIF
jgi:hypothetical protein